MKPLHILLFALLPVGIVHAQNPAVPAQTPALGAKAAAAGDRNLLTNANFEDGATGWELVAFHNKGTMTIDTKELRNGKPTLRIDNVEGDHSFVRQVVKGKPNTHYRLTGYIKTKNVEMTKKVEKSGAVLMVGQTLECTPAIQKTKSWTKVTLEFVPKDVNDIRVGPSLGSYGANVTGTAWFAELTLTEVSGGAKK